MKEGERKIDEAVANVGKHQRLAGQLGCQATAPSTTATG